VSTHINEPCLFCGRDLNAPDHDAKCTMGHRPPEPPPHAEPYTNAGKGIVLTKDSTTKRVADLFDERPYWTSKELNELVGWQFSQAIFALRRRGWAIRTLRIGPHAFAYERVSAL